MVAPVLPLLTDSAEAARRAARHGSRRPAPTGATVLALHLRPGTREWFLAWLAREHPDLVEPYARLYRRGAYVDPEYRRALGRRVAPLLRRHGLHRPRSTYCATRQAGGRPRQPSVEPRSEQLQPAVSRDRRWPARVRRGNLVAGHPVSPDSLAP